MCLSRVYFGSRCRGMRPSVYGHAGSQASSQVHLKTQRYWIMCHRSPQRRHRLHALSVPEDMLLEEWTNNGTWDFLYLPRNAGGKTNLGYAFVNFTTEARCGRTVRPPPLCLVGGRSSYISERGRGGGSDGASERPGRGTGGRGRRTAAMRPEAFHRMP